ncbi:phosphonate metabolism transcriptional regulator PhnF [Sulfitobacter noctilucicola]|uniref:GntR family phosphonate transport system transcriptional regulator n=1 Tax=Sulfitobacter noctilucicola TaxID=1342301 RepID=A0A7W6MBZ2_9RHOB|nr:phosphonate metabolism transcriptional regulator PhnF [Sulfitobacter noctilucicola]MBB4176194.1 GntR family phosphonate transport system transcriptional regulator [Sulfitobacter noctilucicola]
MKKTPIWKAIADALRGDLAEGRYRTGERLPTEAALADRFGVNRHTVRHGISALVEEGLVHTRRGAGAFVAATPTDYPIGNRVRFHENLIAAGRRPEKQMLMLDERAATAGEAQALEIAAGDPVCAYHGLSLADEHPVAIFESIFPLVRLVGITQALKKTDGVTAALRLVGVDDFTRVSTRLTAVRATATQALLLQVAEGDPLLKTTGVNHSDLGQPVEYGRSWFAGDRITLTLET